MKRGLRITLWFLSSLAVLWTLIMLTSLVAMGGLMGDGKMMDGRMMDGRMMGDMPMIGMMAMMVAMGLVWVVMLSLDGLFIYLASRSLRERRRDRAR